MKYGIDSVHTGSTELLAFGEPTHLEPAFGWARNELFAQLAARGFRSIALESDRVAALTVNDYVQGGTGSLDTVLREGFSHDFGAMAANRHLVCWMRECNENRPSGERLTFHGFDLSSEMMSAPSPRIYLEYARDYLGSDLDFASLLGADERWSRTEAVLHAGESVGASGAADTLRALADDMLVELYTRAPQLIAATSLDHWFRAETYLTAGLGLLRYHKQAAQRVEQEARWSRMSATRDALMAQNLLDIRRIEARRGPTLVFAHNLHLRPNPSRMRMGEMDLTWSSAGAVVRSLLGERYTVVLGSLGRDEEIALYEPGPGTYEGFLQTRVRSRELLSPSVIPPAAERTDHKKEDRMVSYGYFPLDRNTIDAADGILHINNGATLRDVDLRP